MGDDGRRFSEAEVEAILRRAIARHEPGTTLSRDELADVLRKMNVDDASLDDVIADADAEREAADEVAAWKERRRSALRAHAISYASVMTGLLALNLLLTPHVLWFVWPMLGWGLGLWADARRYLQGPDEATLEAKRRHDARKAERELRRAEKTARKARRREADEAMKQARDDFADAVKLGVAGLLDNVGRTLRDATAPEPPAREAPRRTGVRVDAAADRAPPRDEDVAADLEALRSKIDRKGRGRA